jgi:hypothetical protein
MQFSPLCRYLIQFKYSSQHPARILDTILYKVDNFIALFVNWKNNRFFPLIRQFFPIPNGINEFVDKKKKKTPWSESASEL